MTTESMLHSSATMLSERIYDNLSPAACKLLLFILDNEGEISVPQRFLAQLLKMSYSQIRTATDSLVRNGIIAQSVTQSVTQSRGTTNLCFTSDYIEHLKRQQRNVQRNCSQIGEKEKTNEKENSPLIYPPYKEKENKKEKELLLLTPSQSSGEQKQLTLDRIEQLRNEVETSQIKIEQYCKLLGLDRFTFIRLANEVLDEWLINEDTDITWKHLTNHMRVKLRNNPKPDRNEWKRQIMSIAQQTIDNINNR